jgi:hypothetical protein
VAVTQIPRAKKSQKRSDCPDKRRSRIPTGLKRGKQKVPDFSQFMVRLLVLFLQQTQF